MHLRCTLLGSFLVAAVFAVPSHATFVIGDFEQTAPGWGLWSGGVQPFNANYEYTTDGATLNNYAIQYTNPAGSGAEQSFAYSAGAAGTISQFLNYNKFSFDMTFPATSQDGWAEVREIVLNSQYGGWDPRLVGAAGQVGWGAGGGGAQTITLEFDYSNHKAAWGANTPGWIEIIIQTNSDANHGVFQLDNVRLIPEPTSLALLGMSLASLALVRRRRDTN